MPNLWSISRDKGMLTKGSGVHFLMEVRDHALLTVPFIRSDVDSL